jgi:hypothetical protein
MRDMPQTFGMRSVTMRVKRILLKLVEDIPDELSLPIQINGSITGLSIYQAIGLSSVLDNGIEMSMGFDKST